MQDKERMKKELLSYIRKLPTSGWVVSTSGNMSVRCDDGTIIITPSSTSYETMVEDDLFEVSPEGEILKAGKNRPTSSIRFHLALMKNRPDCKCIIHTHAPYCLAASTVTNTVPPVTLNAKLLLGEGGIRVSAYAENGSAIEAANVTTAMAESNHACLMQNHGVVTIGASLEEAWVNMGYAEDCCRVWLIAKSTGEQISYIR